MLEALQKTTADLIYVVCEYSADKTSGREMLEFVDGPLTADDIHVLGLDSQPLVVLRSAIGPRLVRAFIESGAWGVIAPRWEMAD